MFRVCLMLLALSGLLAGPVYASEAIGRVVLSIGQNYADNLRGEPHRLKRNDLVFTREQLRTGEKSRLHLKFNDGTSVNLKPNSTLQLAQYRFKEDAPEDNKAVFQLMKGGLRTISGKIGKNKPENYRLQTVLATIGIRGTEYELYLCDRCCANQHNVEEGIAGGVGEGGIMVDTAVGNADLTPGLFFELARANPELKVGTERPALLKIDDLPQTPKHEFKPHPRPAPAPVAVQQCEGIPEGADYEMLRLWFNCNPNEHGDT